MVWKINVSGFVGHACKAKNAVAKLNSKNSGKLLRKITVIYKIPRCV